MVSTNSIISVISLNVKRLNASNLFIFLNASNLKNKYCQTEFLNTHVLFRKDNFNKRYKMIEGEGMGKRVRLITNQKKAVYLFPCFYFQSLCLWI